MFMTVSLNGRVAPALMVPEAALVPEQGSAFVFVVRDGKVQRREVRTGRRRPGEVEIVTGLEAGAHVVVEGTQNVQDGGTVREQLQAVTEAAAPAT
jgi:membrane fusion protein (multidrug efflux system)